jgi:DNA-binding transcriptional regulator YiaG
MKKNAWPTTMETIRETLAGIGKVIDNKETLRQFDELQYEKPRTYRSRDIARLRGRTLRMSQAVFARVCNIRLSTLQKWERGVSHPTPPANRLLQLVEKGALGLLEKQ